MLYNQFRPKRFAEVVGQDEEVSVIKTILEKGWIPSGIMLTGGYGTGKTTLARLVARSMLCEGPEGVEPCGTCDSCKKMDLQGHPSYVEIDAASHGLVDSIRSLKDEGAYRAVGGKHKIICLDESHMISTAGQNALLQILEEGKEGLLFMFATTDPEKMLPTVRSRCVELNLNLLAAAQVYRRLKSVADHEGMEYEDKALKIIGTYVRGHLRDALVLLEQLMKMGKVTTEMTRTYLRLDRLTDVYKLILNEDRKVFLEDLEMLLCNYSVEQLAHTIAEALLNAYKLRAGVDQYSQVDSAFMEKIADRYSPDQLLSYAEKLLTLDRDVGTIVYGMVLIAKVFWGSENEAPSQKASLRPVRKAAQPTSVSYMRKPTKPAST